MKNKSLEKKNRELVKKKLSELLLPYGFNKTKPSFYTRFYEDRIEFIHLHKFTFGPAFRVHTLKDEQDFVALNGIEANGYKDEYPINYSFKYHNDIDIDSIYRCAKQILLFVEYEALPWFEIWRKDDNLYNRPESPYKLIKEGLYKEDELDTLSKKLLGNMN
ncbi:MULTISPECIES: hypothetical protein [unclassified Sutcliffiella]|uniref:hypothetical protein n=1 Tax=unclassified Sutcliffiella TaxID=2837532 RepID=UPI0030CF99A3